MNSRFFAGASALALLAAMMSVAHAAPVAPAYVAPTSPVTGFLDVHGGFATGTSSYSEYYDYGAFSDGSGSDSFQGFTFGGQARGVINVAPNMSVQGDGWFDIARQTYDDDYSDIYTTGGIAGHLSWHPSDRDIIGVLGSIGSAYEGIYGNVGLEAAHSGDNWRLYGQVGVVNFLAGTGYSSSNNNYSYNDFYAVLEGDYFVNPNLMLSANLGISGGTSSEPYYDETYTDHSVSWGAKAEFKPENSPVSFYVAYQGSNPTSSYTEDAGYYTGNSSATNHKFLVGLRLPFGDGGSTVQSLQTNVGLADLNPDYGALSSPYSGD